MYLGFTEDRKALGYEALIDTNCGKRKVLKRTITAFALGHSLKYDIIRVDQTTDLFMNPTQETRLTRTPEASKNALKIRGGDDRFWKFGPGSKARGAARGNHRKTINNNIFADGFVPQQIYYNYHNSEPPLSCKTMVKVSDSTFQSDGNNPPPEDANNSNLGLSKFKGGPSPFKEFNYDNETHTRENIDFSNQRRMNHSYDAHANKCFNINGNRNKQNLQNYEKSVRDYIESPETERINGSYRYEIPAYHYKNPNEDLIITVNATTNEFISVRNATAFQLEKLDIDGNVGYDSRPSMELKLRGPKQ